MTRLESPRWIVLKFGGSSVSSRERWETIAAVVKRRIEQGYKPLVVCSAVSGVTNALERLLETAVQGEIETALGEIRQAYEGLASALSLDMDADARLGEEMNDLSRLATGISLVGEASPRVQARTLASGELMATRMGAAYLEGAGIRIAWEDARGCLEAEGTPVTNPHRHYLAACCAFTPDPTLSERLAALDADAIITQGFIAADAAGDTVVLGRGGSDTSAAYLAARLGAERCEIWTDVPGLYTANPREVPHARLLRALDYSEAQEIASTGAKVVHPRSIAPVAQHAIPLHIRCTPMPEVEGTVITEGGADTGARVKAISSKTGITLVSMETAGMWQQVGFLADAFERFKRHGLSIDLVSTSEMNVTVSLDPAANALESSVLDALLADLGDLCRARVIGPCAAVSLVGRNVRSVLPKLGPALEVFEDQKIHLLSQAASDLNLTFVVEQNQAQRLVARLHELLFSDGSGDPRVGATWRELQEGPAPEAPPLPPAWWERRRDALLELAEQGTPRYVYDAQSVDDAVAEVRRIRTVDRVYYAIKANAHPEVLKRFHDAGLGFETVSPGEIAHLRRLFPDLDPDRILFTPNFAPRPEYEEALALGVHVTVDNLHPLQAWPTAFRDREIFLRLDPGHGRGHHQHVKTAGSRSKFGISYDQLERLSALVRESGARVVGLHAHTGSGILTSHNWRETALYLTEVLERFPDVHTLDLGGGLGIVERPGQRALDVDEVEASLERFKQAWPQLRLWLEPGRFLVARAGVLLSRVTQIKHKGDRTFVGVETGMNTLIRPALYGSYHPIVNLSRLDEAPTQVADVVGPVCESGDVLGHGRHLAPAREGDVLLVANAGAYGRVMSSDYNLRDPAQEVMLPA